MTLYIEKSDGSFAIWNGERVASGGLYPTTIDYSWSEPDLNAIGLYHPEPSDPIPEGKTVGGTEVKRVNGVVKFVDTHVDIPPPAPPEVPQEVTMRQAKLTLHRHDLLATADEAIATMPDEEGGEEARIEWEYAATLRRDHSLVVGLASVLNLDEPTVDQLFIEASTV